MSVLARYQGLSDPIKTERRVELFLVVLLLLLLVQVVWGSYRTLFPSIPDPVRPMQDSLQVAEVLGLSSASPEQRAQITRRPLFWASRARLVAEPVKPEPEVAETKTVKPGKIENVKLSGVFGGADNGGVIVISKGKKRRVMVGEELDGWRLQSLEPFAALFISGEQQAKLTLSIVEISQNQSAGAQAAGDDKELSGQKGRGSESKPKRDVVPKKEAPDRLRLGRGDS